jgi:hypothetical protein
LYASGAVKFVAIFLAALLISAPAIQAQNISTPAGARVTQSSESRQVWVNTATGVYHYPGTRWYGSSRVVMMEANKHPVYKIPAAGGENQYDCLTPMKPPEVSPEERLDIAEQRLEYEKQRFAAQTERMERVIRRVQYLV